MSRESLTTVFHGQAQMFRYRYISFGLFVLMVIFSCEKVGPVLDNPLDPDSPVYEPPGVAITGGPIEGEIVDTSAVTFQWEGNEWTSVYRYRFDSQPWTDWLKTTSAAFYYLDEGEHSFSVQSQYQTGDTSMVMSVTFIVDAVMGPALMFYPRRHIASVGDTVTFQILAEEVENLTAAEFTIQFDTTFIELISVNQGSIFQRDGESIFHDNYNDEQGLLSVLTAILGGEEPSVSGTGDLLLLEVKVKGRNSAVLDFSETSTFRDATNNEIIILETVGGLVTQ